MFGYIQPDTPYLCKSIGTGCGQRARTALTYDMAFMSALIHNIKHEDVSIKKARCALHLIRRRHIAAVDDTTVLIGCINTVLAYYKLCDDKADGERRGILRHLYKKGLKRALKRHKKAVEIIDANMQRQTELEKSGCSVIDMACEPTAQMMRELSVYALGNFSTPQTEALFYDLGKWVYLADALDDYDKDVKKGRYNVLYNAYGCKTKAEAVQKNEAELTFIFDSLFADMRQRIANINFKFNHDLTDNIILRGIPIKTRQLLKNGCKCKE